MAGVRGRPTCLLSLDSPKMKPPTARPPQKQQRQRRRRRPPRSHPRWSSSSGDSSSSSGDGSSSSEDSEPETLEAQKGARALSSVEHTVPDVDLWVPARQGTDQLSGGAASPSAPKGSKTAQGGSRASSGTRGAGPGGIGCPHPVDAKPSGAEGPVDEVGMGPGASPGWEWRGWVLLGCHQGWCQGQWTGLTSRPSCPWV